MSFDPDDLEFFEKWKKGNPAGFSGLYGKYKVRVFSFLLRLTSDRDVAEDILQDTFVAALRNIQQYDKSRSFLSWLFGIAHKRAIDYFRHVKVENENISETERATGSRFDAPGFSMDKDLVKDAINEAIENLDPLQREVFLLREMGDVPYKEIAKIVGCPVNTALGRMHAALNNIRKDLQNRGIDGLQNVGVDRTVV